MNQARPSLLLFIAMSALLVACATPAPAAPAGNPVNNEQSTRAVLAPPSTRVVTEPPSVSRLVLATSVDEDEAPKDDLVRVPADAPVIYLAVQARKLALGSTVRAIWLRDGNEIDRSQRVIADEWIDDRWIALSFEPELPLPSGDYAVRLTIDDRKINSLVFSVAGDTDVDTASRVFFVSDFDAAAQTIQAMDVFTAGTARVVAILTNPLDTQSDDLFSRWYVNDRLFAEIGYDPGFTPAAMSFTLDERVGIEPLPTGEYRVEILLDNRTIASGGFQIGAVEPTPQEEPTATITATSEPEEQAWIESFLITTDLDPVAMAPVGEAAEEVTGPATLYAAVLIHYLTGNDHLELVWYRNDTELARVESDVTESNWRIFAFDVPEDPATYQAILLLNGEQVEHRTVVVEE